MLATHPVRIGPANAVRELTGLRGMKSKVWEMPGGKRHLRCGMSPIHVPTDVPAWARGEPVVWDEINDTPRFQNGRFGVTRGWYNVVIRPDLMELNYTSRIDGKNTTVKLAELGDAPVSGLALNPVIQENKVLFPSIRPNLDIWIQLNPTGIELFKGIRGQDAPKQFGWDILQDANAVSTVNTHSRGWDAVRPGIEMVHSVQESVVGGRIRKLFNERWTGRTVERDPVTRVPRFTNNVDFPVVIDADITEPIAANGDDGTQINTTTWATTFNGYTDKLCPLYGIWTAWRFTTIGIPVGSTIDNATITCTVDNTSGAPTGVFLYGNLASNPGQFSNSDLPSNMVKTVAKLDLATPFSTGGIKVLPCTSIVQEIVNGTWAQNDAMRFATLGGTAFINVYIDDFGGMAGTNDEAILEVDFTAPAGGSNLAVFHNHYVSQGIV